MAKPYQFTYKWHYLEAFVYDTHCKIYVIVITTCFAGAARGLLSSRHLGVKITDFTDFHPILSVFQGYLRAICYIT